MSIYDSCCKNCEHVKVCRYAGGSVHLNDALNQIPIDVFGDNFMITIVCKYFKKACGPVTGPTLRGGDANGERTDV